MTVLQLVPNEPELFSYAALDRGTEVEVRQEAAAIKARLRRTAEDIVEIGLSLQRVKSRLVHGQFGPWLRAEFDMSERTAQKFMLIASRYGARISAVPADLGIEALAELAASSTPDEIREAVEAKVAAGELVTAAEVRRLREEAQEAQRLATAAEARAAAADGRAEAAQRSLLDEAGKTAEGIEAGIREEREKARLAAEAAETARAEAQAAERRATDVEAQADTIADQARAEGRAEAKRQMETTIAERDRMLADLQRRLQEASERADNAAKAAPAPANDDNVVELRPHDVEDAAAADDEDAEQELADFSDPRNVALLIYGSLNSLSNVTTSGKLFWSSLRGVDPNVVRWAGHALRLLSDIIEEYPNVQPDA